MSSSDAPGARAASAVLRKKLGGVQARGYHYPIQRELAQALEFAAAKGASQVIGAGADAIVATSRVGRLEMLTGSLPSPGLLAGLSFADGTAVFAVDLALLGHLVDIRTGGDPDQGPDLPDREPTAIDVALCRPIISTVMALFETGLSELTGGVGFGRWRRAWVERTPAALQFTMPDQPYLMFRVSLDIGEASRSGTFHLALPLTVIEPVETVLRRQGAAAPQVASEDWSQHMRKVVTGTRLELTAVIDRSIMPVADLARLEAGALFPLPGRSLGDVALEIDLEGQSCTICRGRLGAFGRQKAVKLAEPPEPGLLAPLARALGAHQLLEAESE